MSRRALEMGQHGPVTVTFQRKGADGRWTKVDEPRRRGAKPKDDERYRARAKHRDSDGVVRDVEVYRATRGEAEAALKTALARRAQAAEPGMTSETRMSDALTLWEAEVTQHAGLSATSQRVYLLTMKTHVAPELGALRLREVTVARLTDLLRAVATKAPGSAKTARTVLRSFFDLAQRHGAVGGNPVRDVPAIRVDKRERTGGSKSTRTTSRAFTRAERDAVLAFADSDARAIGRDLPDLLAFLAGTGVRLGEALAIRWSDLDLDAAEPMAHVSGTVVYVKGEGSVRQDGGKTHASTRTVALPSWLAERLRERRSVARADAPVVFVSSTDTRGRGLTIRDPSNTAHQIRDLLDAAGFRWATAHTFRKTAGTLLTDASVPLREVANQLGHSRVSTTLDYYQGRGTVTRQSASVL